MQPTLARIAAQAAEMQVYDSIVTQTEKDLCPAFRERHHQHLRPGVRGFGYWCWKPQCILQQLENLQPGDILQYTDAGCHLRLEGRQRLLEYFAIAQEVSGGVLAFQANPPLPPFPHDGRPLLDLRNARWCKGDLLDYLGLRNNEAVLQSQSTGATVLLLRKSDESLSLLRSWIDVFEDDFRYIDDSPSISPNPPCFTEHRHDQSIFSLLAYQAGITTVSAYEYWYPSREDPSQPDWEALKSYPIHARRDRKLSGKAKILRELRRLF